MGYYGDCRDCTHKNTIHRAGSGHDCEFICGYSKVEMDDLYGDHCRNFEDADVVAAAERREQDCKDCETLVTALVLSECDWSVFSVFFVVLAFAFGVCLLQMLGQLSPALAMIVKGFIELYILYRLLLKWLIRFFDTLGEAIWGKSFHRKLFTLVAILVTSCFVTLAFTSLFDINSFWPCFFVFAYIIRRYFIHIWISNAEGWLKRFGI